MAVSSEQVSVGTTATALNDGTAGRVIVTVPTGGVTVFLGGAGVLTTTGFGLAAGATVTVFVDQGEVLYGVVATATQATHVLRT